MGVVFYLIHHLSLVHHFKVDVLVRHLVVSLVLILKHFGERQGLRVEKRWLRFVLAKRHFTSHIFDLVL